MVLRLPDSWSNWNLKMLVFEKRGKPEYPQKNLSEQRREPTTNSTHIITDNQVTLFLHDRTLSRKLFNSVHVKCGFRFGTSNGIYRLNTLCAICYKNSNYTLLYFCFCVSMISWINYRGLFGRFCPSFCDLFVVV